jgi:hypothetical protein
MVNDSHRHRGGEALTETGTTAAADSDEFVVEVEMTVEPSSVSVDDGEPIIWKLSLESKAVQYHVRSGGCSGTCGEPQQPRKLVTRRQKIVA